MPFPSSAVTSQRPEFSVPFSQFKDMPMEFGHVGLRVLTPILVTLQSDVYYMETLAQELQAEDADALLRQAGGGYNRIAKQFTEVAYKTRELGIEYRMDDRMANVFGNFPAAEANASAWLWRLIMRGIERKLITKLTDTATITQTGAAAGGVWDDYANGTPIAAIFAADAAVYAGSGLVTDTVVMSYQKYLDLLQCAEVVDRIKYSGHQDPAPGAMYESLATMAAILNKKRILISGMVDNTADKGQAAAIAPMWTNDKVGVYVTAPAGSAISESCIGRTPTWPGDNASIGTGEDPSIMIESYREESTRSNVYRARGELDTESVVVNPNAGYIITGTET